MSNWTERYPLGKKFVSRGRTITEGDLSLFHNLTWETSELQTDREYMKKESQFGDIILAGPCILACVEALASFSGAGETISLGQAVRPPGTRVVGMLGFDNVRFTNPVKPGDTITVHSEILDIRLTSRNPKRAVLRIRDVVFNQKNELVMEVTRVAMMESVE